jgi:hypothetical protein
VVALTCPRCHAELALTLISGEESQKEPLDTPALQTSNIGYRFTIGGRQFDLTHAKVIAALDSVQQPIYDSYVEIRDAQGNIRELPTKDLLRQAILREYPDVNPRTDLQPINGFQAQRAEHIMRKLGFPPKRKLTQKG